MNIIITDISGASVFVVPIVPLNTQLGANGSTEKLNSLEERFQIINNKELRTLQWSSFFPVKKNYNFVKKNTHADGYVYVAFFELMKKFKLPVRVILTTKECIPFWTMLMCIEDFSFNPDKVGDIQYSIKLSEFPETICEFITKEKEILKYIGNYKKHIEQKIKLRTYKLLDSDYPKTV